MLKKYLVPILLLSSLCHATISKQDLESSLTFNRPEDFYRYLAMEQVRDLVRGDDELLKRFVKCALENLFNKGIFDNRYGDVDSLLTRIKDLMSPQAYQEICDFRLAWDSTEKDYEENIGSIETELTAARKNNDAILARRIVSQNNLQPSGYLHQIIYDAIREDQVAFVSEMIEDGYHINAISYRVIQRMKGSSNLSKQMLNLLSQRLKNTFGDNHPNF